MKEIEITDWDTEIPFVGFTSRYGRAGFRVCVVRKYGKIIKVRIVPTQQPDAEFEYFLDVKGKKDLCIQSYDRLENPSIWKVDYCKDCKADRLHITTPDGANTLWIQDLCSTVNIGFLK